MSVKITKNIDIENFRDDPLGFDFATLDDVDDKEEKDQAAPVDAAAPGAPPAPDQAPEEKRKYFSFSHCRAVLRTHGIEYYALFRNQGMDLESLKQKRENIEPFIIPLVKLFEARAVRYVIIAPRGDRYKKNGFHFVTELINAVKEYRDIVVYDAFRKVDNTIVYSGMPIPPGAFIFDDIITRGTTINHMKNGYPAYQEIIILICNH